MSLLRLGLIGAFVLAHAALADVVVTFQNNVFTPSRLVTFDSGGGVRNGVGASYVARLYRVVGGEEIPIGPIANFRPATTTQPGTWSGANRTIPGVEPGEVVFLRVKAWDASAPSAETAARCGLDPLLSGQSAVFSYVQPVNITVPSDLFMWNFSGFILSRPITPFWVYGTPKSSVSLVENHSAPIPRGTVYGFEGNVPVSEAVWRESVQNAIWNPSFGSLSELGDSFFYHPQPNNYGDLTVLQRYCDECGGCFPVPLLYLSIQPSPQRPYLAVVGAETLAPNRLVLRGLAPRRYRVEQSENLTAWEAVGEFVANTSEVPVTDFPSSAPSARFFRAVEVSP